MNKLLALLVTLAVAAGCGGEARTEQAPPTPPPSTSVSATPPTAARPSRPPSTPSVSTRAPTRPYVVKQRLHVGGQVIPGRYYLVTARGNAWVALSVKESTSWGVGTAAHRLPDGQRGWLSTSGRYVLTASRWEDCGDDGGKKTCVIRLLDTSGNEPPRRLVVRRPIEVVGVTDEGVVVLTEGAALRWDELVWDAAGGSHAVQSLVDSPPMREWAMQGWEPGGFGLAGFQFSAGNVPGQWLGDIVDGQLRPRLRLPDNSEPGPRGRWVLGNRWTQTQAQLPGPRTARILRAWSLERPGKPVQLRAPRGWFFAEAAAYPSIVFWESADAFLALVVDARKGGDRLARCNIPLAACVTVAD